MDQYLDFPTFFNETLKQNGATLKDIATTTGIAIKHLEALSHGRYEDLPATPYLHGYLVKLGDVLDFDAEEWWTRIKTEAGLHRSGEEDTLPKNRFVRKISFSPWLVGGTLVVLVFFVLRFPYIIGTPELVIAFPNEETTKVYESNTRIVGTAQNTDALYVNGERISLRANGAWDKELLLQPGLNTIEIRAKKFLGRETRVLRQFLYEPASTSIPPEENTRVFTETTSTIEE